MKNPASNNDNLETTFEALLKDLKRVTRVT